MDGKSRLVLVFGTLIILICAVFPSWRSIGWGVNGEHPVYFDVPAGRALLFVGPIESDADSDFAGRRSTRIDGGALLAEVAIISAGIALILGLIAPPSREPDTA